MGWCLGAGWGCEGVCLCVQYGSTVLLAGPGTATKVYIVLAVLGLFT